MGTTPFQEVQRTTSAPQRFSNLTNGITSHRRVYPCPSLKLRIEVDEAKSAKSKRKAKKDTEKRSGKKLSA
jgi:hypothetical protein